MNILVKRHADNSLITEFSGVTLRQLLDYNTVRIFIAG